MKQHIINKLSGSFICGWYLEDTTICDKLKDYHYNNKNLEYPSYDQGIGNANDLCSKILDLTEPNTLFDEYGAVLSQVYDLYRTKFTHATIPNGVIKDIKLHVYYPNWGDRKPSYASERFENCDKKITFITFLNNVNGGELEFYYQGVTIKPEKGLTVAFPSDWTHSYKTLANDGTDTRKEDKYIAIGWVSVTPVLQQETKLEIVERPEIIA